MLEQHTFSIPLFLVCVFCSAVAYGQDAGVVVDTVRCTADQRQSYALYLPGNYSSSNPPGLILIFEPAARGKLPVMLYKELADKYNVILACSNNSRNGPVQESLIAGEAVLKDVFSKFAVDRKFILTSGFSGGGRTAVQVVAGNKLFAGVITCGAALPSGDAITVSKQAAFAEVIGRVDMNYQEALTADEYLTRLKDPHTLIMFNGGHQWPPVDAFEDALVWHYLRVRNADEIARENFASRFAKAVVQLDSGRLYEAHRMLSQLRADFNDAMLVARTDSAIQVVEANKRLRPAQKDALRTDERERSAQRDVTAQYNQSVAYSAPDSAFHPGYWKAFRKSCDKLVASDDHYKQQSGKRLIDFAWRLCAEQHFIYMDYDQFRQAAMAARIWSLILPERAGPCVAAAKAFSLQQRKNDMLEYLSLAIERGLKDKESVKNDPAFARYASDPAFLKLFQ